MIDSAKPFLKFKSHLYGWLNFCDTSNIPILADRKIKRYQKNKLAEGKV